MTESTGKPTGKLRERQKAETYLLILESARILFDELGFEKTTMRAVAAKAEIGLGTIYKYFSQKNAMLAAAFHDDINAIMEKAFESLSEDQSLKETLLYLAGRYYDFYARRPHLSKTYITQIFQLDEKWVSNILRLDETYLEKIAHRVDQAKNRGEIKKTTNAQLIATAFHSHYLYVLQIHIASNNIEPGSMIRKLEEFIDLMLSGILIR